MPLMKGSTPMKPISGLSRIRASRCSPPPKPISSRTAVDRLREQRRQIGDLAVGQAQPRQRALDQRALALAQGLALAAAEEGAVGIVLVGHAVTLHRMRGMPTRPRKEKGRA